LPGKKPKGAKTGKQNNEVRRRFDMDLYFEAGFETKVADFLQSNARTRAILGLFSTERDRRFLIFLLCHTVFCRTQQIKSDDAIAGLAGTAAHNVENAREVIEHFSQWLLPHLQHNVDLLCFDEARNLIPTLLRVADLISIAAPTGRQIARDWNLNYTAALDSLGRFIENTTGKPGYAAMAALLRESARALGKSQTYDAHTILVRLKSKRSK
jgi:hypothetical protein